MNRLKVVLFMIVFAISVCLTGCDNLIPNVPDDGMGDLLNPPASGDDTDNGNGGASSEKPDGEDGGEDGGTEVHVCDLKHVSYMESTCTVAGSDVYKCSCGKSETVARALLPHTEEIIPATEATDTSPAKTEGKKCSVCGCILLQPEVVFSSDYSTPAKYDGNYAYSYLQTLENAENLIKLYNAIDKCADLFHVSGENADDDLVVAEINFGELGIDREEAIAVWSAYSADHPLYYWISKKISYTSVSLSLKVDEEYKLGSVRNEYNGKIYKTAEKFISEIKSDSEYSIALTLHDLIISAGDYAYESDGVTPKDDNYAHNILGILEIGEGVCESYAKSFQMMLNYCGVENVFVSGDAGEAHAWNMVKLDDGKWYWFDLTWDDKPDFMWGVSYRYFCVNNTEPLMNMDGPWVVAAETFGATHTPNPKCDTGIEFMYSLPEISSTEFSASEFLIRKTFKVGDFTYAIVNSDSVQLVKIERSGEVVIPEGVEYEGRSFDVVSIGRIDENGLFKTGSLVSEYYDRYGNLSMQITSLSIPESVTLIWDDAFNIHTLEAINVDAGNETYASVGGVLFTKDLSTLVKYPSAKSGDSYTLPEQTVRIAAYAFNMYFTNVELSELASLKLGTGSVEAGITHYGYGYADTENGNFRDGEWARIETYLKGDGEILTSSGTVFVPAA